MSRTPDTSDLADRGPNRRELICGGCALLAAGCASPGIDPAADRVADITANDTASGDNSSSPTSDPSGAGYPCGQTLEPGASGWTELPLASYPELGAVGGWVAVTVSGREIVVAHVETDCFVAMLRACAHEGVAIDYHPDRYQFVCPLHGAVYDWQGDKVSGPQPTGLPVYPVGADGGSVWVQVT